MTPMFWSDRPASFSLPRRFFAMCLNDAILKTPAASTSGRIRRFFNINKESRTPHSSVFRTLSASFARSEWNPLRSEFERTLEVSLVERPAGASKGLLREDFDVSSWGEIEGTFELGVPGIWHTDLCQPALRISRKTDSAPHPA